MVQLPLFPKTLEDLRLLPQVYWPYDYPRAHQGKCLARGKYGGMYEKDCLIDLATKLEIPNPHIKAPVADLPWDLLS
jgi:hypothetical protein